MDSMCRFPRDYLPSEGPTDHALDLHLQHCGSCREQFVAVARTPFVTGRYLAEA